MNHQQIIRFLESLQSDKNLSKRTIKAYTCDLKHFSRFFVDQDIIAISSENLREYLQALHGKNLKATSIKRKLATLKVLFQFLENENIIKKSPTTKLKGKFRIPKRLPRSLTQQEIQKLLLVASKEATTYQMSKNLKKYQKLRNKLIIELLFTTGMRIDELTKLDIIDIDTINRTVIINGKGNKERLLYIANSEVLQLIDQYTKCRNQLNSNSSALLLNNRLERLSVHSIGVIFNNLIKKCNFEKHFTPHCLRHTMATMLVENGADVRSVQEILGHSNISTTEIYVSVSKKRKKEVMERFNGRNSFNILQY